MIMKYEKLSEDEVTTEAQRLVAVPIVTYVNAINYLFKKSAEYFFDQKIP